MKEDDPFISVKVAPGETSEIFLGRIPTEGGFFIQEQASHFTVSEIRYDSAFNGIVYRYASKPDFRGMDKVVIDQRISIGTADYRSNFFEIRIVVK